MSRSKRPRRKKGPYRKKTKDHYFRTTTGKSQHSRENRNMQEWLDRKLKEDDA